MTHNDLHVQNLPSVSTSLESKNREPEEQIETMTR